MTILLAMAGTLCALVALVLGHATIRVARANVAVYETNRLITESFGNAAAGRITPLVNGSTDFRVNHFAEPRIDGNGNVLLWERAGSLSDEAVDGVLTRQH